MSQWSAGFLWVRSLQLRQPHPPLTSSSPSHTCLCKSPGFSFTSSLVSWSCVLGQLQRTNTFHPRTLTWAKTLHPVLFGSSQSHSPPYCSFLLLSSPSPRSPSSMLFETKQTESSHSISPIKVIFQSINNKSYKSVEKKREFQKKKKYPFSHQIGVYAWSGPPGWHGHWKN